MISDVIEGLKQYGACTEPTWAFYPDKVNDELHPDSYHEGAGFLIENVKLIPVELDAWKTELAQGQPLIFGLALFNSFNQQRKPGLIPPG